MSSPESAAFTYTISLVPQLITIVAAIGAGFKFLQRSNDRKIEELRGDIMQKFQDERESIGKDMKGINAGITNLDGQYRIITDYIKNNLERHDRMLERLDDKNTGRFGGSRDVEGR